MNAFNVMDELKIEQLFNELISIQSDTGTALENQISSYIHKRLSELPYFQKNTKLLGKEEVKNDPFNRSIVWGLIKGKGSKTIVLMNHHDAINLDAYGKLGNIALDPTLLKHGLRELPLDEDVVMDLDNSDWIFGRGTADMKSGIAMQLWAMEKMSSQENLDGNILFISVGDEENLSAGMRQAVLVLDKLKNIYGLDFKYAINSEPYDRNDDEKSIYYEGSVGKVMPVIYARGKTSHVGQVYSGLNPTYILSSIQSRIEVNPEFSDVVEGEVTAPPTWVYMRDMKKMYDASIPDSAAAYFSVLTMTSKPSEILSKVKALCIEAFDECITNIDNSYFITNERSKYYTEPPRLISRVLTYEELSNRLKDELGTRYEIDIKNIVSKLKAEINTGNINLQDATISMIESMVGMLGDNDPIVVVAYSGPYYPHIANLDIDKTVSKNIKDIVHDFSSKSFGSTFDKRNYFLGISDFSYVSFVMDDNEINTIEGNMPGWGDLYYIPLNVMKDINMSLVNFGPRGKDIHKMTERVSRIDAFNKVPQLMMHFIEKQIFG